MKTFKTTGNLFIIGAVGVFIPYILLTITFNYPAILRQDAGTVLTQFHAGGAPLIFTWLAFALLGLPLLAGYVLVGQKINSKYMGLATTIGIVSGMVQIIGLLRWVFVVPVLAQQYVATTDPATQQAIKIAFTTVHQFGGVLLGEHIGQLFTVVYTVLLSYLLVQQQIIAKWVAGLGYIASAIYFLAQAELLATVIPNFPVWDLAGLIGSTLWLVWLLIVGVQLKNINWFSYIAFNERAYPKISYPTKNKSKIGQL